MMVDQSNATKKDREAAYTRELEGSARGLRNRWRSQLASSKVRLQQDIDSYNRIEAQLAAKYGIQKGRHKAWLATVQELHRPSGTTTWLAQILRALR